MKRNIVVAAGAVAAALTALALRRRSLGELDAAVQPDRRAEDLRRKLAQARETAADEDDFEVAGMAAETKIEEPPPPEDVDEARRRVHEEARAVAEEMGRDGQGEPG